MDSWNEKQINSMRQGSKNVIVTAIIIVNSISLILGGNDACNAFLARYKVIPQRKDDSSEPHNIFEKYNSPAAALYKDRLRALIDGSPVPNDISTYMKSAEAATTSHSSVAQGSDPLPGESNDAYVTRQRQLQVQSLDIFLL
jgi:hypothetical protein